MADDPERSFEINPALLIAAEKAHREGDELLLGYYHSHPVGDAAPSRTDARLSAMDGRIWAIIGQGHVRLWRNEENGERHKSFTECSYTSDRACDRT